MDRSIFGGWRMMEACDDNGGSWFPSFPLVFLETRGFQDQLQLYIIETVRGSIFDRETN